MDADVTVVGAGPVGLVLAAELALAGVSVQVLERRTEPDETIKAGSINVPTAEALARRGLLPELERVQREVMASVLGFLGGSGDGPPRMPRRAGHFAAMMLDGDLVDESDPDLAVHGPTGHVTLVPQRPLEALLAERVDGLGVPVHWGVAVTGLRETGDGVVVDTDAGPAHSAWIVGCDGGRSVVRALGGFDFPGTDAEITGHQAVVDVADPEKLARGWTWTPDGVYCHGPLPGRILTVEFDGPPADRGAPVTLTELQASLRRASGTDVTLTALRGSGTRWTDNARQATTYRRGRLLLAGDAAHVHSPFGGQGLNLGVGDAMNLGWKLAATVAGWAPDGLLDTYTAERHPLGAWVLDWTRGQVALMRGDAKTAALRRIVDDLLNTREGMTHVVKQISGVTQRLDLPGEHPLVGRSMPDPELTDGSRLSEHGHAGGFLLLDRTPDRALAALGQGWKGRVTVVTPDGTGGADGADVPVGMLVRPDGIVAWAVDAAPDAVGLEEVLRRWAGAPGGVRAAA